MERKLRFLSTELEKGGFKVSDKPENPQLVSAAKIEHIETEIDELDRSLRELNKNRDLLYREFYESLELQHVLHKDSIMLDQQETTTMTQDLLEQERESRVGIIPGSGKSSTGSNGMATPLLAADVEAQRGQEMETRSGLASSVSRLGFVTGVILREKLNSFQRVLFRATHGNMFLRDMEIGECVIDPNTLEDVDKNVFIVFYAGERAGVKVKKICESFGANLYDHPKDASELRERIASVTSRLEDLRTVIWRTVDLRKSQLSKAAQQYPLWHAKIVTQKATYHILNQFNYDASHQCLIAEAWCPVTATHDVELALSRATNRSGAQVQSILRVITTHEKPPTYFYTNRFTKAFQAIVDAYGIAGYREINPTPFTIITFPFLFAVMFGDIGHGALMVMYALFLLTREKTWKKKNINEMLFMTFQGRYLILLMGLFSLFTGMMYNETFSVTMDVFGTKWTYDTNKCTPPLVFKEPNAGCMPDRNKAYPFGMDPIWRNTSNELLYTNSLKMKLSVIFGVTQMILGVILSGVNAWARRDMRSLYFEFIPQMLFMCCSFGYLVITIFIKWNIDWDTKQNDAPSLITMLINFFMSPGKVDNPLFSSQAALQVVLVLISVVAVPWMLFPKPLLIRRDHKRLMAGGQFTALTPQAGGGGGHDDHGVGTEEFDFMEVMVIQIIHTIEFVLGAVSNTASYLRLWALSLAHAQLSTVFWDLILATTANSGKFYMMFIGFAIWFAATLMVLMAMESLSAFLHALRLHWVEFQNKFYHGDGHAFVPFDFAKILTGVAEDDA
eukprot:TRINITY_DN3230_c0_g1_i2.p1 TRINITY_DN3230_c0_g1~~TRINITY_DN3230_c0_g1_i2.p1  ORF type:complete len:788 (-),score=212.82 TRINITY_DN3230_c0_g1_i2:338-2701(-)